MTSPFHFGLLCRAADTCTFSCPGILACYLKPSISNLRHVCLLQTHEVQRELHVEKRARKLLAARRGREVQAYSIALQQADADLEQHRLHAVQQLAGKHAALQHGVAHPSCPAQTSFASHQQIPSIHPGQAVVTAWSVAQVCSILCSFLQRQGLLQMIHCRKLVGLAMQTGGC